MTVFATPLGLNNIIGGLMFGIGMVLAGGCASGVLYRAGEGYITAFTAIFGIFTGIAVYAELYGFILKNFIEPTTIGKITLYGLLDISPWWLVGGLSAMVIAVRIVNRQRESASGQ